MLTKDTRAKEIWGDSLSTIKSWLDARQKIVVLFCDIAGVSGQMTNRELPDQIKVNEYCRLLLDYTSIGHFEIYEQIIGYCKGEDGKNLNFVEELYLRIKLTTETVLNFNDKYAVDATDKILQSFDVDLSDLGEVMESRFRYEDQLLDVMGL
ncbi:MAG: sigma D regulator [Psychromonas sp.]|nr:sigma D regulator [Psychromonas sp.]